jgi:hypothetical protein
MTKFQIFCLLFLLQAPAVFSQVIYPTEGIEIKDFSGTLHFLSSDWMEGREAGTRGAALAAGYIGSEMESYGLMPFGDATDSLKFPGAKSQARNYFQQFILDQIRLDTSELRFSIGATYTGTKDQLLPGKDFNVNCGTEWLDLHSFLVFAGYGIYAPGNGINDYSGIDVRNKIVVVLKGYPGYNDSTSIRGKLFSNESLKETASLETKCKVAKYLGASAFVEVIPWSETTNVARKIIDIETTEPGYADDLYILPGDTAARLIPCFQMTLSGSRKLFENSGIDLDKYEKTAASGLQDQGVRVMTIKGSITLKINVKKMVAYNILGMIPGKNPSRYVVIGAHYDHLGLREGNIYHGSDDNASGVSAMLALAKYWSNRQQQPPCNLLFASWTAEEKGLLGSDYFVHHLQCPTGAILLDINMDMVSRSAPEDTARLILSVGTVKDSDPLKELVRSKNAKRPHPFKLDLWDATGHTGSDYASFASVNVPVMTFFSGFHDDYHTPGDVFSKADLNKMAGITSLVNSCLDQFLQQIPAE